MKKIGLVLILVLVILQFIPALPESAPEPEATSLLLNNKMPENVKSILSKACNDCHSNSSNWPWYARVAPVSLWIGHHVEEGREHFNMSEWENYEPKKKAHKIEELVEMVKKEEMPLPSYTWIHGDARLTIEERATLIMYFESL